MRLEIGFGPCRGSSRANLVVEDILHVRREPAHVVHEFGQELLPSDRHTPKSRSVSVEVLSKACPGTFQSTASRFVAPLASSVALKSRIVCFVGSSTALSSRSKVLGKMSSAKPQRQLAFDLRLGAVMWSRGVALGQVSSASLGIPVG